MDPSASEQLERSARMLVGMPPWMASSTVATRYIPPLERPIFRQIASGLAHRYGLYVTVEESDLCSACFFRRDE